MRAIVHRRGVGGPIPGGPIPAAQRDQAPAKVAPTDAVDDEVERRVGRHDEIAEVEVVEVRVAALVVRLGEQIVEHSGSRFESRFDYIRYANRFESIRSVKKSAFRFTSCHAVFALNK